MSIAIMYAQWNFTITPKVLSKSDHNSEVTVLLVADPASYFLTIGNHLGLSKGDHSGVVGLLGDDRNPGFPCDIG